MTTPEIRPGQQTIGAEEIVGQRCLMKLGGRTPNVGYHDRDGVQEYKVLELSPAGQWVKLQNDYGTKFWKSIGDVAIVEILKPLRRPSEPKPVRPDDTPFDYVALDQGASGVKQ